MVAFRLLTCSAFSATDVTFKDVEFERDDLGHEFQKPDVGSATEVEREFISSGSSTMREAT